MIGVYKIVNPKGRVYIGQSININRRINEYENNRCNDQPGIYNSLIKYGFNKHNFTVLELCEIELLNERERYYQEKYNSVKKGLNCKYVKTSDKSGYFSDETKKKISMSAMGNKYTLGYKHTEESKLKISRSNKGKRKGFVISKEQRDQHSILMSNGGNSRSVKVINIKSNKVFDTIKQAAESESIPATTLRNKLSGYRNNDTPFRYK